MRASTKLLPAILALLASGCPGRGNNPGPTAPPTGRAEDASVLPSFEAGPAARDPDAPVERFKVELGDAPTLGRDDAPVTIVMYSDFECPFCLEGHETMAALRHAYRDKLRFAYKPYPLPIHSNAVYAALAARSAQAQGKFWAFHDKLYQQQGLDPKTLARYADEVGMDVDDLRRDLADLTFAPEVTRDMRHARRMGVDSTPSFFINGRALSGAQPPAAFVEIIDEEIDNASQWVAEGVAPQAIYAHAIAEGYTKVEYERGRAGLDPDTVYPVPVGDSPTTGPATAPITIVAFGDFECPYCSRGHAIVEQVRETYGDKIRLVYKHSPLPFHSFAFLAARAAVAADTQGKFWAFHDALYQRQAQLSEEVLLEVAKAAGLDVKRLARQMTDLALDHQIEEDQRLAAALGVRGTPAYFINGRALGGAQPVMQFRLIIEEELRRAAAVLAGGVTPEGLYDALLHEPLP